MRHKTQGARKEERREADEKSIRKFYAYAPCQHNGCNHYVLQTYTFTKTKLNKENILKIKSLPSVKVI